MKRTRIVVLLAIVLTGPFAMHAQPGPRLNKETLTEPRFVGIPIITYNRNFGLIFGGFGGFYYPMNTADTISPPSFGGLGGIYTSNGTGALMGFSLMYLFEDSFRLKVGGGYGNINFQYFNEDLGLEGAFVNYTSTAWFLVVTPLFQISGPWYIGPDYSYLNVATEFEDMPAANDRRTYSSLGVAGEYDTRGSKTYPLDGLYCTVRLRRYADWLGSASEYTKLRLEANRYVSLDTISILALRASAHAALGTVPFEAQTIVGQGKDIRGYSEGKYRGDQVYSIQGEYRWNFRPPFGAVGFLGFALPVTQGMPVKLDSILPGIGAGFRYTMIPDIHANVGVDVAVGRGDYGIYFRIGEAF